MDGRPTGTPPPDSLRAAWSGHLRDQRRVVLNLRHSTEPQTPKTGQNDTFLGVLFVQMHKASVAGAGLQPLIELPLDSLWLTLRRTVEVTLIERFFWPIFS
jgi:hypothetical protein